LATDLKTVEGALGIKLDCSSDIEKSRFEPIVSTSSGFGSKRLTSKAFVAEIPATGHPRLAVIPPLTSRKVSDLRAKFEQAAEQSATSFPRKIIPDLQFVKKRFIASHTGEGSTGLQEAGENEAAKPLPGFLAEQTTKLPPFKNNFTTPVATLKSAEVHKGHLSRLTNELDQPIHAEAILWLEVGNEENDLVPPPPIPRKSSKRAANSLPGLNQQEQQVCYFHTSHVFVFTFVNILGSIVLKTSQRSFFRHKLVW
jgi:hypothetical protein